MRILIFSQYFTPEVTAAPVRLHPLAAGLARLGHEVEVICEVPNHPQGSVHPGYGDRLVDRRGLDGFGVTHVRVTVSSSKHARARLASYASYAAMASAVGSLRRRPDVIVASSPPLSVGGRRARRRPPPGPVAVRRPRPLAGGGRRPRRALRRADHRPRRAARTPPVRERRRDHDRAFSGAHRRPLRPCV